MYGIALSVSACLRGGTRVDVAWCLDPPDGFDPTDAVAITPGGGRLGGLLNGAVDSRLVELSLIEANDGRIVDLELDEIEAAALGVDVGTVLQVFFGPAEVLPAESWPLLLDRRPVTIELALHDRRVVGAALGDEPRATRMRLDDDSLRCEWSPTTTLVVYGGGPMADALARAATFVGWQAEVTGNTEAAIALATSLSPIDGLVVLGHDTEAVGRVLQTALSSQVGYIGSIGPARLQEDRGDWLAYRGVTDTSRISGPAGIAIGAGSPEEVALSVITEMIAVKNGTLVD